MDQGAAEEARTEGASMNRFARILVELDEVFQSPEWQTAFIMALIAGAVLGFLALWHQ